MSAAGERDVVTHSEYDKFGRFEIASVDPLEHRSTVERDPTSGQVLSARNPNGLVTTFEYDEFGRLQKQVGPTGISTSADLVDAQKPGALPKIDETHDIAFGLAAPVKYAIRTTVGALPPAWSLFDSKGREIRQVSDEYTTDSSVHRFVFRDAVYDSLGRIVRASIPYEASDQSPKWTVSEYDALGRVCASTAINGLRTETLFVGDPKGGGTVIVIVDPRKQLSQNVALNVDADGTFLPLSCGHEFDTSLYRMNGLNQETTSTVNMRKEIVKIIRRTRESGLRV